MLGFRKPEVVFICTSLAAAPAVPMDSLAAGKTWDLLTWVPSQGAIMFTVCKVAYLKGACLSDKNLTWKGTHYFHNRKSGGGAGLKLHDSLAQFASSSGRGPTGCSSAWHGAGERKDHLFFRPPRRRERPVPEAHGKHSIGCHVLQVILSESLASGRAYASHQPGPVGPVTFSRSKGLWEEMDREQSQSFARRRVECCIRKHRTQ